MKNSVKTSQLLGNFATKRREFVEIYVSLSLSYGGKFADLQFADWLT